MDRKVFAIMFVTLLWLSGHSYALEAAHSSKPPEILLPRDTQFREAYISKIMLPLRTYAQDHQFLTQGDIDRSNGRDRAAAKSAIMSTFFIIDANGDNTLDRAEIAQAPARNITSIKMIISADADHDGIVTLAEALQSAQEKGNNLNPRSEGANLQKLLALDPNADGKLTATELEGLAVSAFAYYDRDGDGVLSPTEKKEVEYDDSNAAMAQIQIDLVARCSFPKIDPHDKLYLITAHHTGTLSSTTVVGQDKVTEVATIVIGEGTDPLYLAVSAYAPIIWRVEGHVERVAQFYGTARGGVGVVGLPREKVSLVPEIACLNDYEKNNEGSQAYLHAIASGIGHRIDGILFQTAAYQINVPQDIKTTEDDWTDASKAAPEFTLAGLPSPDGAELFTGTLSSLKKFNPGGVADIDPKHVIAFGAVERYEVLPQQAGILQLLQAGFLEEKGSQYPVRKPFARYPAGLTEAQAVTFVFTDGMKLPSGNPGRSGVVIVHNDPSP